MFIFSDFGFIDGGSFEVSFYNSSSNSFFIAFLNARERIYFNNINRYLAFTICQKPRAMYARINYSIDIKNGGGTLKGYIPTKGVYYPFFLSCIEVSPRFELSIKFMNGDSHLDYRVYCQFLALPTALIVSLIGFILSIYYQIVYKEARNNMIRLFNIVFSLNLLHLGSKLITLYHSDISDESSSFLVLYYIFSVLFATSFFVTLLLIANGYCIVKSVLSFGDILQISILSLLYMIFLIFNDLFSSSKIHPFLFLFYAIILVIFCGVLVLSIQKVEFLISAHLCVIARAGIDPTTTPIYSRKVSYELFTHSVIVYFSLWIAFLALGIAEIASNHFLYSCIQVMNAIMICIYSYLFRVHQFEFNRYILIDEAEHILKDDVGNFQEAVFRQKSSLIPWEKGIMIPPPPVIDDYENELPGLNLLPLQ